MSASSSGPPNPPGGGYFFTNAGDYPTDPTAAAAAGPRIDTATPGSAYMSGSGSGSQTAASMSGGRKVEQEVQARLLECDQYTRHAADYGAKPTEARPVYPSPGYTLVRPIGVGTYGSVWEAHPDDDDGRTVAIKFFPRWQGNAREFISDTRHLKRLTNENGFIQLLDVNTAGEWPYFVMTHADRSLQAEIDDKGPLPVRTAERLFALVVKAMAHAHAKKPGLCHCDLKPSNVLLGERSDPLVSDFGQSRLLDDRDRAALGTFFFMPPEQADLGKETPDSRWDVYALGAIFYQMVNPAKMPPRTEGWEKVGSVSATKRLIVRLAAYREHLEKAPPPTAHRAAPGMDRRLADIVDRCLELNPDRRFADAGAILEALRVRDTLRRRAPVLRLGVLATLAIVSVAVGAGLSFRRMVVDDQKRKLTEQVVAGQQETAYIAARLLEDKLRQRVNFLKRVVPDNPGPDGPLRPGAADFEAARVALEKAVEKQRTNDGQPLALLWLEDDRRPVDEWVMKVSAQAAQEKVFDRRGMGVAVHANGYAYLFSLAMRPGDGSGPSYLRKPWTDRQTVDLFKRNFSWRDWFGDTGYTRTEDEHGSLPHKPVTDTHISVVYQSRSDGRWIIDVSRPIWGVDKSTGKPAVVGLLTGGTDVGKELTGWMEEITHQSTADGKGKPSAVLVVNDRGILVWRPELLRDGLLGAPPKASGGPDPGRAAREKKLNDALASYGGWDKRFEPPADGGLPLFDDPWDDATADGRGRKYIATAAQFFPTDAPPGGESKPWWVIVEQPVEDALRPVDDLQRQMVNKGLMAGAVFLVVAGLLWGGVFWVLRRTEGPGLG